MYVQVFCKALIGVTLKDNEFLKLEQTYLADIIAGEEGNEHIRGKEVSLSVPLLHSY